ncbi:hypothetical protein ACSLUB_12310 [Bordetella hinzii]|uniref:hypothetical protein n=1 Tax=Bordetella hinzii TaxID=103855 RepID=UPI003F1A09B1
MKQEIIRLLERAKEDGRTIGDVLAEVRGIAEPVADVAARVPIDPSPFEPRGLEYRRQERQLAQDSSWPHTGPTRVPEGGDMLGRDSADRKVKREAVALKRGQADLLPALASFLRGNLVGVLAQGLLQRVLLAWWHRCLIANLGLAPSCPLNGLSPGGEHLAIACALDFDLGSIALRSLLDARHVGLSWGRERGQNGAEDCEFWRIGSQRIPLTAATPLI